MKLLRNKKPKISVLSFVILGLVVFGGVLLGNVGDAYAVRGEAVGAKLVAEGPMKGENGSITPHAIDTNEDGFIGNGETGIVENGDGGNGGGDGEDKCGDGGGAKSLGWIVCPLMSWAGEAAEGFYNTFIEPSLRIEPQLFTGGSNNTLAGWQTFQNIANIIFAILFMVVIFSQITGVGIDNYGIKKILPKLIITAVLINLSYFICILLVDVSNIIGSWAKELFDGLEQGLNPSIADKDASFAGQAVGVAKDIAKTGLVSLGVAGALVGMSGGIWGIGAAVVSLFVSLMGVFVSMLMLFILLAARQAAVVVMIVISPLAVVCYALPNTKNLFDKWLKIFKVLLLLYPIAGLLVGGGNYVSVLLLSIGLDGIFQAITAMLAGIIPIFFIPSLTRSALAGIGNLGAKISGVGNRISAAEQKGVQSSQAYQGAMEKANRFKNKRMANGVKKLYDEDGNLKKGRFNRVRQALYGGRGGASRINAAYLKDQDARYREDSLLKGSTLEAAEIAQKDKAMEEEIENKVISINSKTRNGKDSNALNALYDQYRNAGDEAGMRAVVRAAGQDKIVANKFMEDRLLNYDGSYDASLFQAAAKEATTGKNSSVYKSRIVGFTYLSDVNKMNGISYNSDTGQFSDASGRLSTTAGYTNWRQEEANLHNALEFIDTSQALLGQKGSSLTEINDLKRYMGEKDVSRIEGLARDTYYNKDKLSGQYDTTKEDAIKGIGNI